MLMWQLKSVVYIILLNLCLGEELFHTDGRNDFARRFEREQSARLLKQRNESGERRNGILESHEVLSLKYTSRGSRMKRETNSDISNRFNYRADEGEKASDKYQPQQEPEKHLDSSDNGRRLNNNREKNGNTKERSKMDTHASISGRFFETNEKQRRLAAGQEYKSIRQFKNHLDNKIDRNVLNNNREKSYIVLERFDEGTHAHISDRGFENIPEERRENLEQVEGRYFARRLNNARELSSAIEQRSVDNRQKQVYRQNILQRRNTRRHEESKPVYTKQDKGRRSENLQCNYMNKGEGNERLSILRQPLLNSDGDSYKQIHRETSLRQINYNKVNGPSDHTNSLTARETGNFEQRDRLINRNSYCINQKTAQAILLSNFPKVTHSSQENNEFNVYENRRTNERIFRIHFDDRDAHRDINRNAENQELAISYRHPEDKSLSRRVAYLDAARRLTNGQKETRRIESEESWRESNKQRKQHRETEFRHEIRKIKDNKNGRQEARERLNESELLQESRDVNSKIQRENSLRRTDAVTQIREENIQTSKLNAKTDARGHRSLRLEGEHEKHFSEHNDHKNDDMRERVEKRLERRVDRETQSDLEKHLASFHQDIAQRSDAKQFYQREMRNILQETQRVRLDTSERKKRQETPRQSNVRNVGYGQRHEHESARKNKRFETLRDTQLLRSDFTYRYKHRESPAQYNERETSYDKNQSAKMQNNDKGEDSNLLERFIIEPRATNHRNERFIEDYPSVPHFNGCTALGQVLLFAYITMKACNGKNDLKTNLHTKLHEALAIIGF